MEIIRRCCCRGCGQKTIRYNELKNLMYQYNVIIIDVRSQQEYYEGHYDGAINIPLFELKKKIGERVRDKNQIIVVYCSAGIRSMKAQNMLNIMGYSNVYNLIPGYQ